MVIGGCLFPNNGLNHIWPVSGYFIDASRVSGNQAVAFTSGGMVRT